MYKHLDIPLTRFTRNMPPPPNEGDRYTYLWLTLKDLEPEFVDWMEENGMRPKIWVNPVIFYAPAGARTSVHTDDGHKNSWALNIVLDEQNDSNIELQWKEQVLPPREVHKNHTQYPDAMPLICATKILRTICRTSIPHASFNHGPSKWILSLRTHPLDWFTAIKKFT